METPDYNKLVNTLAQFPDVVDRIVKKAVKPQSPTSYEAFMVRLPVNGQAIPILGLDLSRACIKVYSSVGPTVSPTGVVSGVRIGHLPEVNSGEGFPVPNSSTMTELSTTDTIYAVYTSNAGSPDPLAILSVWVEKWSE